MSYPAIYATRFVFPRLDAEIHDALSKAGVDLFRVPRYRNEPLELTLELEALDERDAFARVRAAVAGQYVQLGPEDVVVSPAPVGTKRWYDGPPE